VLRTIDTESLLSDDGQHYHTLGGLAMPDLGRVPRTGDVFERRGYRFEVVDMDGNRVDRVLVSQTSPTSGLPHASSRLSIRSAHLRGRTARDQGARPCAPFESVRPGFKTIRAMARTARFPVQDSMRTMRYQSSASSATMMPSAPAGVTT
jgi:hypothetical protein